MDKKRRIILISVAFSLLIIGLVLFAYQQGYIFKPKWTGDYPYDDYYCIVYNIYPKYGEGMAGNLPPECFACYVDTDAPPDHVFAKFEWNDDNGWHRSGRIWFSRWNNYDGEVTQIDNDTYYVKYFVSDYTSASQFTSSSYYQWKITVYYCDNPTAGAGASIWYVDNFWLYYTDDREPLADYPTANAGGPYITEAGKILQLDGSKSSDNGKIVDYIWDIYNDGTWDLVGVNPKVKFSNTGTYEIKLRVIDNHALYDDDVTTVTVTTSNNPPVADADGPYSGKMGEVITLDGSGSYDPDGNPLSYEWDVNGDGKYEYTGETVSVRYYATGNYTITLKVSDGQYSDTDTTYVVISSPDPANQLPVADADGPYYGNVSEPITLDGSGSYDPDGYITDWKWDINNDGVWDVGGQYATVSFRVAGNYTVKLMVIDNDGGVAYDNTTVNVNQPIIGPIETDSWERTTILFLIIVAILFIIAIIYIIKKKGHLM